MGDYLRDRFPLATTDNVYMDGKAGRTSRGCSRTFRPCRRYRSKIIAPVTLTGEQAKAFCDAVRTARAEAWDEGVAVALNHAIRNEDGITLRLEHLDGRPWANPYREGGAS